VVAATGYKQRKPGFLRPMEELVRRDEKGRYKVALDHSIELDPAVSGRVYVSNADLHSHGVAAPDLGIGAFRNATILNSVSGRELYRLPKNTAYTSFAVPGGAG
jgi:lysine N6-hydroxylase